MLPSLVILTASCLSGAAQQPSGGCACAAGQPQPGVVYYDSSPATLRERLRSVLGLRQQSTPYPVLYAPQPVVAQQQTLPPPEGAQPAQLPPVAKKNEDKVGHEDDYSWITGQLFYVRADGGRWILRYGRIDEVDKYGGSVVLAPTVEMRNYREGDVVCVFGQIISDGPATRGLGGPLYRANSINMVERSDP